MNSGQGPLHSCLPEISDHDHRPAFESPSVGEDVVVRIIQQRKVSIDEDIFVGFTQPENGRPIFKHTAIHPNLRLGVDVGIAFVFSLPWLGCREAGIGGGIPLAGLALKKDCSTQPYLHGRSCIVSGFEPDFLVFDLLELLVVGMLFEDSGKGKRGSEDL